MRPPLDPSELQALRVGEVEVEQVVPLLVVEEAGLFSEALMMEVVAAWCHYSGFACLFLVSTFEDFEDAVYTIVVVCPVKTWIYH